MEPPSGSPTPLHHDAAEFVRFCYRRRRVGWPELYDEMCAVAARGLYLGMHADDLAGLGIGFSLFDMPALAGLANTIVAEEHARRRPVAVAIVAEEPLLDLAIEARGTASFEHAAAPLRSDAFLVDEAPGVDATPVVPDVTPVVPDVTAHLQDPAPVERQPAHGLGAPARLVGIAATV